MCVLSCRKYAARPALARALCDYLIYVEHNMRRALELAALCTQAAEFKARPPPACLYVCWFVCLFVVFLLVCLSVCLSVCQLLISFFSSDHSLHTVLSTWHTVHLVSPRCAGLVVEGSTGQVLPAIGSSEGRR